MNPTRYVIYARRSQESDDRQILSIPSQLDVLRELAKRSKIVVSEELTESASAREPGRPVFSRLLRDIESGKVHGVLCWRPDRLARNPVDGGQLIHWLGKGKLQEIVTPEGTYTGTGDSKFMLALLFGAATKFTDDLAASVKRGNKKIHELGRITGIPPLGYIKLHETDGRRGAGRVVHDPERFEIVRRIWQTLLAEKTTVAEVWRRATKDWGLTTRPTAKSLSRPVAVNQVYELLRNPFYTGKVHRNGHAYDGEHPAMVTEAEFERVQLLVKRRIPDRPAKLPLLYRGLLHCGHCTRLLVGEVHTNRYGHTYTYYRCGRRRQGYPECHAPAPTEAQVTEGIVRVLPRVTVADEFLKWAVQAIDWWAGKHPGTPVGMVQAAEKALARAERELSTLTDLVVGDLITEREYKIRRQVQLNKIENQRRALAEPAAALEAWQAAKAQTTDFGSLLAKSFHAGDDRARRELVTRIFSDLVVTDRKVAPRLKIPFILAEPNTLDSGVVSLAA